jgi:hypothetical protein
VLLRTDDLRAASGQVNGNAWAPPALLATVSTLPAQFTHCIDICPRPPAGLAGLVTTTEGGVVALWRQEERGVVGSVQTTTGWTTPKTVFPMTGSVPLALRDFVVAGRPQGEVLLALVRGRDIQVDAVHVPALTSAG